MDARLRVKVRFACAAGALKLCWRMGDPLMDPVGCVGEAPGELPLTSLSNPPRNAITELSSSLRAASGVPLQAAQTRISSNIEFIRKKLILRDSSSWPLFLPEGGALSSKMLVSVQMCYFKEIGNDKA